MYLLLLSFLSLLATGLSQTAGCDQLTTQSRGSTTLHYIQIGPILRHYHVFLPSKYSSSEIAPLILSYHGNGKTSLGQEGLDLLNSTYFNNDHIVVYPQGVQEHWQPGPYANVTASDLDFTAALLDEVKDTYCIDTTRIYATGKSVGGGFVSVLACDPNLGPKFAAFAPVSPALYWDTQANQTNCTRGPRVGGKAPILEFHGMNDTTIPYAGGCHQGVNLTDIDTWAGWWAVRNGATADVTPTVTSCFDDQVEKVVYEGYEVEHWKIWGLGHAWPSTEPNSDFKNGSTYIDASTVIMDWFRKHNLTEEAEAEKEWL